MPVPHHLALLAVFSKSLSTITVELGPLQRDSFMEHLCDDREKIEKIQVLGFLADEDSRGTRDGPFM